MTDQARSPVRAFFGGLLMVAGVVIGGLSGLCTAGFLVIFVSDALKGSSMGINMPTAIGVPLLFGVLPVGIGVALFLVGRSVRRRA